MKRSFVTGHLDLLVLAVLRNGAKHGYAVIEELRARSDEEFDLPEGTVYPALHRLEKAGCLVSDWSVIGGRRRRTYSLTDVGRAQLAEQQQGWARFAAAVDKIVDGTSTGGAAWSATT